MKLGRDEITELFDTSHTIAERLFEGKTYPWEVLADIRQLYRAAGRHPAGEGVPQDRKEYLDAQNRQNGAHHRAGRTDHHLRRSRHPSGAFLRGRVIVGERCVVGNSCELKNVILFDGVQVPHYNYVGDSILGYKAHMGAGSITSNVKSDKTLVMVHAEEGDQETGLKKFGAMLGDGVEVGCNSVLNPGTVIGRNTNVYPLSSVRGCVPANSIYKAKDDIVTRKCARWRKRLLRRFRRLRRARRA